MPQRTSGQNSVRDESTRRNRGSSRRRYLMGFAFVLAILVGFLPQILTSGLVLNYAVGQFAGLQPLQLNIEEAQAGWFSPVRVAGIQLSDSNGDMLLTIDSVTTEKSLLGWAMDSSNLGNIVIERAQATLIAEQGTTNFEEALAPLLSQLNAPSSESSEENAATVSGTIDVRNAKVLLVDKTRPEQWEVRIPELSATLPDASQITGPVKLQIEVEELAGLVANSRGTLAAQLQQNGDSDTPEFELRAKMENVPLEFWHLIKTRLPELPVDALAGRVSGVLAGKIVNESAWTLAVSSLRADNFRMVAPELVGPEPAILQSVRGNTTCSVNDNWLSLANTSLVCDFAEVSAEARVPWPIQTPTLTSPFFRDASLKAKGVVDLPKLTAAAESLLPVRSDMQLVSGQLQFDISQTTTGPGASPTSKAYLGLQGLSGIAQGQKLDWDTPLSVNLEAKESDSKLQIAASTRAEFANLRATGSPQQGELQGALDLSRLYTRLSQFVDLPIRSMEGSVEIRGGWSLSQPDLLGMEFLLATTPISLATSTGKRLEEQAWAGEMKGDLLLANNSPVAIQQAQLQLQSRDEKLILHLKEPMSLNAESDLPPATFSLDIHTDLAKSNYRGIAWLEESPEVELNGKLQLAANGRVDLNHIELFAANWNGQPIQVVTPQLSFSEPKVVGSFRGRFDSGDVTRTIVESLELTSSSVSLIAQDQAAQDGVSRLGRAKFLVDLSRLLKNANTGQSSLVPDLKGIEPATSQYTARGMCDGELAWQINSASAGINLLLNAKDLAVLSQSPTLPQPSILWQESQATTNIQGTWKADSNQVELSKTSLQTPWLTYSGNCTYDANADSQALQLKGQAQYDAFQLSQKLNEYTGGQLRMAGQQAVPIEVTWSSSESSPESSFAGLNATARLGWEQASVAGIQVGRADVPVRVENGILQSATEIPVSGGLLRWDLRSDLSAEELVLEQAPMTILENVEINEEMCKGWLKYVTPLLAEATSVDGRLSLTLNQAEFHPTLPENQTVSGNLIVHNATVGPGPLSNSLINLVKQVEAIRKQDFTQTVSSTQKVWMDMPQQNVQFSMVNGQVTHQNLNVKIGDANISTHGSVALTGAMSLIAQMPIPDDWAEKSPWLAGLRGQVLEFPMGGTVTQPQVDTRLLSQLGQQTIQNAASGALQQGINRGLEKLIGESGGTLGELLRGPQTQPTSPAQPAATPSNSNPLKGLGDQLLNGQGFNLPGLFGGQNGSNNGN